MVSTDTRKTTRADEGREKQDTLRVLVVADLVEPQLYNCGIADWLAPVDLVISCGDLPPHYLDFLITVLGAPMVHVLGNHCYVPHDPLTNQCSPNDYPGVYNLAGRVACFNKPGVRTPLLLAGLEGSPVYNGGPHQYTEQQAAWNLGKLIPGLLRNKLKEGRYLDILVTHTPPRGIHDYSDVAHRGFESLLPFIERFKPAVLVHGHSHRYDPMLPTRTRYKDTEIINAYGHVLLELTGQGARSGWQILDPVSAS